MKQHSSKTIYLTIFLGQLIAGGTFPIAKVALNSIEPLALAFIRFTISSCLLLAITYFSGRARRVERNDWTKFVALGILAVPLNQLCFLYGLKFTTPARSALYYGATPAVVFTMAIFYLKEKVTMSKVIGIFVSFFGVAVILRGSHLAQGMIFGDVFVIIAAVAWSGYTVLGKSLIQKYGAIAVTAYAMTIGTLLYLPFGLHAFSGLEISIVPLKAWFSLAYIVILTSVLSYIIWYWALARMEASKLAIFQNLQPLIATILSVILVSKSFGIDFYVGGTMVIAGVLLTQRD